MMVRFIPAKQLQTKYDVFGHFYSVEVAPNEVVECRSVLEIVGKAHIPEKLSALTVRKPNAVIVMMNPGSSRPLIEINNRIHAKSIHRLPISLVPTKPDTTQYQVMRLMHFCEWQHVRVLNLSDLRCSKSGEFFKQFKRLEDEASFDSHSDLFDSSQKRTGLEAHKHRQHPRDPCLGIEPEILDPLIERCLPKIGGTRCLGGS